MPGDGTPERRTAAPKPAQRGKRPTTRTRGPEGRRQQPDRRYTRHHRSWRSGCRGHQPSVTAEHSAEPPGPVPGRTDLERRFRALSSRTDCPLWSVIARASYRAHRQHRVPGTASEVGAGVRRSQGARVCRVVERRCADRARGRMKWFTPEFEGCDLDEVEEQAVHGGLREIHQRGLFLASGRPPVAC